ncbi:hypothetical protein BDF22DRAFT_673212 [Syncephalis plumigaleata]|nr:hypothetical protein BDF22DRAFT_673212 [Syncephalis plumigaleata]
MSIPNTAKAKLVEAVGRHGFHNDMLPPVDAEQPLLIRLQEYSRTPNRDLFFIYTTNLGNHTFFLLTIPILFWCGFADVARGLTIVMTLGVFLTGLCKDLLCLPRPLSPPIRQLTFSKSHQLEYGFPSTHTANAVSIGLFLLAQIEQRWPYDPNHWAMNVDRLIVQALVWFYMISISFGRLYCGMHGLVDVGAGFCYEFWHRFWSSIEIWIMSQGIIGMMNTPVVVSMLCLGFIVIHPDPAEPCPCIDDSIAVIAVDLGLILATWHYSHLKPHIIPRGDIPFDYAKLGLIGSMARVIIGVLIVFVWRLAVKYTCYKAGHFPYRKFYMPPRNSIERCPSLVNLSSAASMKQQMATSVNDTDTLHQRGSTPSNSLKDVKHEVTTSSKWSAKPRYDIDIVTKIIVYAGVGWWSMAGVPLLFPWLGLS